MLNNDRHDINRGKVERAVQLLYEVYKDIYDYKTQVQTEKTKCLCKAIASTNDFLKLYTD